LGKYLAALEYAQLGRQRCSEPIIIIVPQLWLYQQETDNVYWAVFGIRSRLNICKSTDKSSAFGSW